MRPEQVTNARPFTTSIQHTGGARRCSRRSSELIGKGRRLLSTARFGAGNCPLPPRDRLVALSVTFCRSARRHRRRPNGHAIRRAPTAAILNGNPIRRPARPVGSGRETGATSDAARR